VASDGDVSLRSLVGGRLVHQVAVVLLGGDIFPGALEWYRAIPVVLCLAWAGEALPHFLHGLCLRCSPDRPRDEAISDNIPNGAQETDIVQRCCTPGYLYRLVSFKQRLDSVRFGKGNYRFSNISMQFPEQHAKLCALKVAIRRELERSLDISEQRASDIETCDV
jgi:hypothetical protein